MDFTTECKKCGRQMKPFRCEIDECCISARYRCPTCNTGAAQLWPCKKLHEGLSQILRPGIPRLADYIGLRIIHSAISVNASGTWPRG